MLLMAKRIKIASIDKSFHKKKIIELETEIAIAIIFAIISGLYVLSKFGSEKLFDTLFLWLFPASVTVILTLIAILFWEIFHGRH